MMLRESLATSSTVHAGPQNVLLCGTPAQGELAWLATRIAEEHSTQQLPFQSLRTLRNHELVEVLNPFTRLILCSNDRPSFPFELAQRISSLTPELPIAHALGAWWEGSARSSSLPTQHLMIPWYRWQETWRVWLEGNDARLFTPTKERLAVGSRNIVLEHFKVGAVFSRCKDMLNAWESFLFSTGIPAVHRIHYPKPIKPEELADVDIAFWDDTCLSSRLPRNLELQSLGQQIQEVRRICPSGEIWTAFTMPRWDTWSEAIAAGADNIVGKPIL